MLHQYTNTSKRLFAESSFIYRSIRICLAKLNVMFPGTLQRYFLIFFSICTKARSSGNLRRRQSRFRAANSITPISYLRTWQLRKRQPYAPHVIQGSFFPPDLLSQWEVLHVLPLCTAPSCLRVRQISVETRRIYLISGESAIIVAILLVILFILFTAFGRQRYRRIILLVLEPFRCLLN